MMTCNCCEEPLSGEELESPQKDDEGKPMCDECYHEQYEFTCCDCREYGHVDDRDNMLVVFEECDSMGGPARTLPPGIYAIKRGPYFGGPLIGGGYLFGDNLERIADVNPDMDGEHCPCGHLCAECQAKVLAQFSATCSECRRESRSCLRVKLGSWKDFERNKYQWNTPKVLCAACRHAHKGSWKMVGKRAEART